MLEQTTSIISKVWGMCNPLRDDGVSYQDYDGNGNQTTQTEQVQTAIAKGSVLLAVNIVDTGSEDTAQNIVNLAKEKNIPYQKEIMNGKTGTNADHITISKGGVPSALVSLPQRYMHTPVEVVDIRDIENCAKLIAEFLERV